MFTRWSISNFKSIREPVTLELAPLTIFSGINSSGKSTLIQSILMVTQSLASLRSEEALILNGHFVDLGELSDVCHHGSEREPILLGFDWIPAALDRDTSYQFIDLRAKVVKSTRRSQPGRRVDTAWPMVQETTITFEEGTTGRSDKPALKRELSIVAAPEMKLSSLYRIPPSLRQQVEEGLFNYAIARQTSDPAARPFSDERVERVALNGLLPQRLLVILDEELQRFIGDAEWVIRLLEQVSDPRRPTPQLTGERRLSPELASFIEFATLTASSGSNPAHTDLRRLERILSKWANRPLTSNLLINELTSQNYNSKQLKDYADRLRLYLPKYLKREKRAGDGKLTFEERLLPVEFSGAVEQIRQLARQRVYYLGPLRDEPRVIYQTPPHSEQWSVGLKGEYTAAVLDEYTNFAVNFPLPPGDHFAGEFVAKTGRLGEAVTLWLRRMGLVDSLDTEETPKVGYRLTVNSPGSTVALDLTSVGVGVSQVLPTLVQALLAPVGSVLIFEQPELHLHPKVQSVLGDFFLGMAQLGKQCIVETHSEHLINRLRRRIVEAQGRKVLSSIRIYFAEKEGAATRFRSVEPNEYGAILDWPEGFFDQAEFEASILLREQLQKRQQAAAARSSEEAA
jgi:predicted ATPase